MFNHILSIDTSRSQCLVAVRQRDDGAIISESQDGARQHASVLLPLIDTVLAKAQLQLHNLDAIAFARGPGSFTGIRLAACAIQGLAFGAKLGVVPVSSLAVLAQSALLQRADQAPSSCAETAEFAVAVNAHMGELFCARFAADSGSNDSDISTPGQVCQCLGEEMLIAQDRLLPWYEAQQAQTAITMSKVGNGWALAGIDSDCGADSHSHSHSHSDTHPEISAAGLVQQVEAAFASKGVVEAAHALPTYLRGAEAWQKTSTKMVLKS